MTFRLSDKTAPRCCSADAEGEPLPPRKWPGSQPDRTDRPPNHLAMLALERAALAWTEVVTMLEHREVPDELLAQAVEQFSEQELADLTMASTGSTRLPQPANAVHDRRERGGRGRLAVGR